MEFNNAALSPDSLPQISQLSFSPVEADYIKVRRIITSTVVVVCLALLAVAWLIIPDWVSAAEIPAKIVSAVLLGISLIIAIYCWLADPKKCFALRDHDLSYQSGLIVRKTITQPITRVQHIEVKQGPIERRYNLACLLAYSAGGHMHTFVIPGLRFEEAKQMRAFILDHKEAVRDEQ
ncbi:MAG: PH domain-containing protein [Pseudomonadales bacterium]|jgi:membrane protein YdbS with pleckstrin-like domain